MEHQRGGAESGSHETLHGSHQRVPFAVFDRLFYRSGDATEPEDETWLNHRDSRAMHAFAQQLFAAVRGAHSRLEWADQLVRHTVSLMRSGHHPYAFLDREVAIQRGREHVPNPPAHSAGFYRQLDTLLDDPELTSVAYRAAGDYAVLRAMAVEQRRRAGRTGHCAGHALHLSALVIREISNEAWDSDIWFFEEGLGHGDMRIEGGEVGGAPIKVLVDHHDRVPGRYILRTKDEGTIDGFDREMGNGWVLYR